MDTAGLALALLAGAVAAFNPCGFALLPAYLTLLVAGPEGTAPGAGPAVARALRFTAGMTVGFVAIFGAFGLVVAPLALAVERWLPVATIVLGVLLLALGVWLLAGRTLPTPTFRRAGSAPTRGFGSQVGYGVTFALASLSCTIAPFLAVTTSALRSGSVPGVVGAFLAYAIGMGAVVGVLAVLVATASTTATARLRRATPVISRFSGVLLLLAGAYIAWYGWFELRVLAGGSVDDPLVSTAIGVQGALTRFVLGLGTGGVLVLLGAVTVVAVLAVVARRRSRTTVEVG